MGRELCSVRSRGNFVTISTLDSDSGRREKKKNASRNPHNKTQTRAIKKTLQLKPTFSPTLHRRSTVCVCVWVCCVFEPIEESMIKRRCVDDWWVRHGDHAHVQRLSTSPVWQHQDSRAAGVLYCIVLHPFSPLSVGSWANPERFGIVP